MAKGKAGLNRPFVQSEYAVVISTQNKMNRDTANDVARKLRSVYGDDPDIIPSPYRDGIALVLGDPTSKDQLDRVEREILNINSIERIKIQIKPV